MNDSRSAEKKVLEANDLSDPLGQTALDSLDSKHEIFDSPSDEQLHKSLLLENTISPSDSNITNINQELSDSSRTKRKSLAQIRRHRVTSENIATYLHIHAIISSKIQLPITVKRDAKIEDLVRQIEAQYAFKYKVLPDGEIETSNSKYVPLECGALLVEEKELSFDSIVQDVLCMGDCVNVVNVYEGLVSAHEISTPSLTSSNSNSVEHSRAVSVTISVEKSDKMYHLLSKDIQFQNVLYNPESLRYFMNFCFEIYCVEQLLFWLDVELFRASDYTLTKTMAKYIQKIYIHSSSPLRINLPQFLRKDLNVLSSVEWKVNRNIFDDAQQYIFDKFKNHTFQKFESTDLFTQMLDDENFDPVDYTKSAEQISPISLRFSIDKDLVLSFDDPFCHDENQPLHSSEREIFLAQILRNYGFANSALGYFTDSKRLSPLEKKRKILKNKKINRFFGEQLSEDLLSLQLTEVYHTSLSDSELYGESSIDLTDPESHQSKIYSRKKKVDKLAEFFGNRVPGEQILELQPPSAPLDCSMEDRLSVLDQVMQLPQLTSEERRILTKRRKKLKALLGDPLDEETISKSIMEPIKNMRSPSLKQEDVFQPSEESSEIAIHSIRSNLGKASDRSSLYSVASSSSVLPSEKAALRKQMGKLREVFGAPIPTEILLKQSSEP